MKYNIGNRIRFYREDRGLNQKQLAELIGVSNSRISNWEQGLNRPDADIIGKLCTALNVSPSELLDIQLAPDDLSDHERKVIQAFRSKPDLQRAINILLGLED